MAQNEARKLYVDYFETDDKEGLDFLADAELPALGEVYENFQLARVDRSALQTCIDLVMKLKLQRPV